MAGIAPLKAHLVKTTSGLNPHRRGIVADISPEVLFIVHAGDSAVYTVLIESYTLFLPRFFYALLMLVHVCVRCRFRPCSIACTLPTHSGLCTVYVITLAWV